MCSCVPGAWCVVIVNEEIRTDASWISPGLGFTFISSSELRAQPSLSLLTGPGLSPLSIWSHTWKGSDKVIASVKICNMGGTYLSLHLSEMALPFHGRITRQASVTMPRPDPRNLIIARRVSVANCPQLCILTSGCSHQLTVLPGVISSKK